MRDELMAALLGAGEIMFPQIKVTGDRRALGSTLTKMCEEGYLHRRMVSGPKNDTWAYTAINTSGPYLRGEPDYCYYLRTLGKPIEDFGA